MSPIGSFLEALASNVVAGRCGNLFRSHVPVLSAGLFAIHVLLRDQGSALLLDTVVCPASGAAVLDGRHRLRGGELGIAA